MDNETRAYLRSTLKPPPLPRNRSKGERIYRHFKEDDTLYYEKDGKWYCIVDDLSARGYRLPDGGFLPHDYQDLISYEQARAMCLTAGIYFPKPGATRNANRVPPPLLHIATPQKKRPAWNRSSILRHIDETLKRKAQHA